jgi:hypothetical protein
MTKPDPEPLPNANPKGFKEFGVLALGPGTCQSTDAIIKNSSVGGHRIHPEAIPRIEELCFSTRPKILTLVVASAKDLGLKEDISNIGDVLNSAKKLGLELCPKETGAILFNLRHEAIADNASYWIASKPIEHAGCKFLFKIMKGESGNINLYTSFASEDEVISSSSEFIFVNPGDNFFSKTHE